MDSIIWILFHVTELHVLYGFKYMFHTNKSKLNAINYLFYLTSRPKKNDNLKPNVENRSGAFGPACNDAVKRTELKTKRRESGAFGPARNDG